jgi:hypothetical protein
MRPIDANALMERADEVTFMGFQAAERKKHLMDLVSAMAESCPTIDAVPVVRCGECKHYNRPENWPPEYTKGRCFLDVLERRVHPDDFCSCGERKGGEDDGENETN